MRLLALAALGLLMLPGSGLAACKLTSAEIPVTMMGSRAVATVGINGTRVPLIVDSGAFYSMLTHAAAQQLQLKVGPLPWGMRIQGLTGEIEAGATTVKRLTLRDGEIPDVDFVVGGNGEGGTMGLLGRNILAATDVEYDLAHGVIRLMFPNDECRDRGMAYWAGDTTVSTLELLRDEKKSKTPAIEAIAQLNEKKLRVLFDTGAQSAVTLRAAKRAGITDMVLSGRVRGAGSGSAAAWTATADKFELGGEAISNIRIRVADFDLNDIDMLLGIDFFLSHRIYISKKQRRMYFTYNGGPVFALSAAEMAKAKAAESAASAASANAANAANAPDAPGASGAQQAVDATEPKDAAGYARRGAAFAARLDFERALADLDRACEMAPEVAEYWLRRGAVHESMRKGPAALKDYDRALQLAPAQTEALLRRARMRAGLPSNRGMVVEDLQALDKALAPQAYERVQLASLYLRFEMLDRALQQWNLWVPAHPYDATLANVLNARCRVRMLLNIELDQALDDCDKAIDLDSKNPAYYDSRAWLRLRRDDLRRAGNDFERALKLRPETASALYGQGIVRRKQGETESGQADIEAARKLQPSIDALNRRHGLAAEQQAPPATPKPGT